jgi:hypothetical protein
VDQNTGAERALTDLVATVGRERQRLVDAWEATALIESLGYTDSRIRREFGFADAGALGAHVFATLAARRGVRDEAPCPVDTPPFVALVDSIGISLVYALPWLITFVVERARPEAMRMPGDAAPSLSLALMISLITSGGFVQAISRRGQFYLGLKQPGLAALVCGYLLRLGAAVSVAVALTGIMIGWYFSLFSWPYLVLWADECLVLSALWMMCGILALRNEHWRVPVAFALGGAAFVAVRATGYDAVLAQLVGSAVALAAAAVQASHIFVHTGLEDRPSVVPMPRMTVLLYRVLPFFWYGMLYFSFLFADRFAASASVLALTGGPFGMRPHYKLGMDLALLTFLFAAAGIEYANIRFSARLRRAMRQPYEAASHAFTDSVRRLHVHAITTVIAAFVPVAVTAAVVARRLLPGEPESVWTTLAIGDIGYLLLAIGLSNALVLFSLNRPWSAVNALTGGLAINIFIGFALSHAVSPYFAAAGLVAGGLLVAVHATVAVQRTIGTGAHAVAIPA